MIEVYPQGLPGTLVAPVRALLDDAFAGTFGDDDWEHALGGSHVVAVDPTPVAHAAVVARTLLIGGRSFSVGYVEAVGTAPRRQRSGIGSLVVERVNHLIRDGFALGALSTGRHSFYERLGWERWEGPTFVRKDAELLRTPDDDGDVMVLRHGPARALDLRQAIACDARPGDPW